MNFEVKDPHKMRAGSSEEPAYRTSMSPPKMRSRTELIVTIESARHLPKMDVMGKCDTCCVAAWQGQEYTTTVKKNSYSPDWNETFAFPVENISIGSLSVVVMDWDMVSKNDVIGEVVIPGDTLQAFWQGKHTATVEDSFAVLNKGKAVIGNDNEPCVLNLKMRLVITHEEMSPAVTAMKKEEVVMLSASNTMKRGVNEQVTDMRQELDQAAVERKLIEEGRKHVEQQNEILKHAAARNGGRLFPPMHPSI
jgi:hypothetical protein